MPDALSGEATALLALWNDVDPAREAEYEDWHAREHVPERLTVPGIVWALRYARLDETSAMPRYLTLYGLRDAQVLASEPYQRLLAQPTPGSRAMRPALQRLARWVCTLEVQTGIARFERLAVQTMPLAAEPAEAPAAGALLRATLNSEAAALPWLSSGQASPVTGERLAAWAHAEGMSAPGWRDAVRYGRLPIGA